MMREDIYDHLAQVYLGKRKASEQKNKRQYSTWLFINVLIMVVIFSSVFYGLSAFLTQNNSQIMKNVLYSLHKGLIRIDYDFGGAYHPTEKFSLSVPPVDASKYSTLQFSIRAKEEGSPGIVKVAIANAKNESSYFYVQNIDLQWKEMSIPLAEFQQINDWKNLKEISFVLESWNIKNKKGVLLIDDVNFSGIK